MGNMAEEDRSGYGTARRMGEQPESVFNHTLAEADTVRTRAQARAKNIEVSSEEAGPSEAGTWKLTDLCLSYRLADRVFLGW